MQNVIPNIAPLPRRSRRRWLWIGVFVMVVVATPFVGSLIGDWMLDRELAEIYREMDEEDPHWRWEEMVAHQQAPLPDDENAAVQLAKVSALLKKAGFTPPSKGPAAGTGPANQRLRAQDAKTLHTALAALPPNVLDEAHRLKDMPRGRIPIEPLKPPADLNGPDYFSMLSAMQMLGCDAMLRGHDREPGVAAESCLALFNAANAIGDCPNLMGYLIWRAGQVEGATSVERLLGQGNASEKTLQALQAALEREAARNGLYPALRGERAFVQDFFVQLREGKTSVSAGVQAGGSAQAMLYDALPSLYLHGFPKQLRLVNEEVRASKLRGQEQLEAFRAVQTKIAAVPSYLPTFALPLSIAQFAVSGLADEQLLRCAIIAVAAERFRLQRQRWPNDAGELVKNKLLTEVYKDSFDGQPLRWRHTPAGLAIYSIGTNEIDDSAKLVPDQHRIAVHDIGFVLWNPALRHVEPMGNEMAK